MSRREVVEPSLASEQVVIGVLVESPDLVPVVLQTGLQIEDFLVETHQRIFRAILEMSQLNLPIDFVSLLDHMGNSPSDLAIITDAAFGVVVARSHVQHHASLVKKKSQLRQLQVIGDWLEGASLENGADPSLVVDGAIERLQAVTL